MSASHYSLLKNMEPSAPEASRVPSMRTIQALTSPGYGVDSLTHNKRYSGVGYFDIPEAYPLNHCQVPVTRSCGGTVVHAATPTPSFQRAFPPNDRPQVREDYDSYNRGQSSFTRKGCESWTSVSACEKCGGMFYPTCKPGYKAVWDNCSLCSTNGW